MLLITAWNLAKAIENNCMGAKLEVLAILQAQLQDEGAKTWYPETCPCGLVQRWKDAAVTVWIDSFS